MLFSSLTFIFLFLPLCLFFYFISRVEIKNIILLIFSLIFYAWGEPKYILLMILTVLISYVFGILINKFDSLKKYKLKKVTFILSIIIILSSLFYFKYTNFFIDNINRIFNSSIGAKEIILPIGISFYTFQILSYLIDLYRNKIKVQKNFLNLALYIAFFPQLIAGPIVRYESIEKQLTERKESLDKVLSGIERFIFGLGKKVIIANNMALIADLVFDNASLSQFTPLILILGMIAYTLQIYFDFSGYSDMAIGLGKIFGFEFLENFNYPYIAKSVSDFWKRWHISLTTFFREYIYIPLGGNRVSKSRWILNMSIVWLLTGFWHGAAWTFIFWGIYYLVLLLLERTLFKNVIERIPDFIRHLLTLIIIIIGWTLFRANRMNDFILIIHNLFSNFNGMSFKDFIFNNPDVIPSLWYLIPAIIFSTNIYKIINDKLDGKVIYNLIKKGTLLIIFIICIAFLVSSMYNPFIYFRF